MKIILFAGLLLAACGSAQVALPPYYTAVVENPKYPQMRFITGVGMSGASQVAADQDAVQKVVTQISAQVESETTSFQQYTSKTGDTAENVSNRVSVRSSFDRADLVAIVERARQADSFYAYAALDRAVTDREMAAKATADLASFRSAAETAKKARAEQDMGVFASASSEALKIRPRLDAAYIVRRAVARRPAPDEADYVALRNQLLAVIEEVRARRVVGVVLKNNGNGHLGDFAVNAVKRLGLRPDGATCDKRPPAQAADATELEVDPEENCSEGSLGE
ncbi:MAG TPA: LPP20 family lipoprotein, partial [Myxococcales bacterium]|nr:LPP20 family lipoprotein [Myxococcales bacterium]